jgi:hypothetical protein
LLVRRQDCGGWLRSLGLEQYEATFRENGVDETVLPKLTAEDVKDLGVTAVGHRRKLLDAIALLGVTRKGKHRLLKLPRHSQSQLKTLPSAAKSR